MIRAGGMQGRADSHVVLDPDRMSQRMIPRLAIGRVGRCPDLPVHMVGIVVIIAVITRGPPSGLPLKRRDPALLQGRPA